MSDNVNPSATLMLERQRFEHERALQHERFQSESGLAVAKGVFLLNGAAIVGILSFLSGAQDSSRYEPEQLTTSIHFFIAGLVCAVLCHGAGNFWHRFTVEKKEKCARFHEYGTYILMFCSLGLGARGAILASMSLF